MFNKMYSKLKRNKSKSIQSQHEMVKQLKYEFSYFQ